MAVAGRPPQEDVRRGAPERCDQPCRFAAKAANAGGLHSAVWHHARARLNKAHHFLRCGPNQRIASLGDGLAQQAPEMPLRKRPRHLLQVGGEAVKFSLNRQCDALASQFDPFPLLPCSPISFSSLRASCNAQSVVALPHLRRCGARRVGVCEHRRKCRASDIFDGADPRLAAFVETLPRY